MITFGGSGIEKETFEFIKKNIPQCSNVLEFGSGDVSTPLLSNLYNLTSIESDIKWLGKCKNVKYVFAPIVDGWYDTCILNRSLHPYYDFYFIDGPTGNRDVLLEHLDFLNLDAAFLCHDANRPKEINLMTKLGQILKRPVTFYSTNDNDFFAYIPKA